MSDNGGEPTEEKTAVKPEKKTAESAAEPEPEPEP